MPPVEPFLRGSHARRREGEVAEVPGEAPLRRAVRSAEPGVVRFAGREHVLDVGLSGQLCRGRLQRPIRSSALAPAASS